MNDFSNIFRPGKIGNLELKNRLVMSPMVTLYATKEGEVTDRMIDYYVTRAKGGIGLIIIESAFLKGGQRGYNNLCIYDDKFLFGLERLAHHIKSAGAKVFIQLNHGGRECSSNITGQQIVAPSPLTSSYRMAMIEGTEVPKQMDQKEIEDVINDFCLGAERAQKAGFDGIELHGAHGYLIGQFLSPYSNGRSDKYGGDIYGRLHFLEGIIDSIKDKLGDFPISVRMNGEDAVPSGNSIKEAQIIAGKLEQKGVQALHVSSGFHESRPYRIVPSMAVGKRCYAHLAAQVKSQVRIPIIAVGRITKPTEAEQVLAEGMADFIALGRALITDPEFPNKTLKGELGDIRTCIGCNQGCIDMVHKAQSVTCIYNPSVGRERESDIRVSKISKKIDVIGGGIAGMEAAYILAMRGHKVDLYEKSAALGGQVRIAAIPPTRQEISHVAEYLEYQLKKWNVQVHYGKDINEDFFEAWRSDVIILATGSLPNYPDLPGFSGENILMAEEILQGKFRIGKGLTAIIGGGLVGCETADYLGEQGNRTVIFEMLGDICIDAGRATRIYLIDKLKKLDVRIVADAKVTKIENDKLYYEQKGEVGVFSGINRFVIAMGYCPNSILKKSLDGRNIKYYELMGENNNILQAIHNAFWVAMSI